MKISPVFLWIVSLAVFPACTDNLAPANPSEKSYTLSRGDLSITIDPNYGARVSSLKFRDQELLQTTRDSAGFTWGSTAWPSPQASWGWPPPVVLDSDPYTVQKVEEHSILLISAEDSETGLTLQKRFRLGPDSDVGCTYWLTYRGPDTMSVAAWEITRMPYQGRVVFASDSLRVEKIPNPVDNTGAGRTIIFDGRHPKNGKVFAQLDTVPVRYYADGLLLEKFTAVKDYYRVAPGQAPLEIYLAPEDGFLEFELQGDYRTLSYGETATLRTRWRVTEAQPPNQ